MVLMQRPFQFYCHLAVGGSKNLGERTFSPLLSSRSPHRLRGGQGGVYHLILLFLTFSLFSLLPSLSLARLILVPGDYDQIHVAVEFARRGDTVLVAPGTYNESVRLRSVDFVLGSHLVTSGDPAYIDETIIDGTDTGSPVIRADGGGVGSPLMRGFTVTGGMTDYGGGIMCWDSTRPVFEDLRVVDNEVSQMGGGAYCYFDSSPTFRRVNFDNNRARVGGAVTEYEAQNTYEYCTFTNNSAQNAGGIYSYFSKPILENCQFAWNTNVNLLYIYSHPSLLRVTIDNGDLASDAVYVRGGNGGEVTTFDRVTFISSNAENATLLRVINASGGLALPRFNLINSIVRGEANRLISLGDGAIEVTAHFDYCNIEGERNTIQLNGRINLLWGENNFNSDPNFVDVDNGNYGLSENSPCINAGDENSSPDPDNSRADLGGMPFGGFPASIYGNVKDLRFGQPVAGAEVILTRNGDQLLRTETNQDGNWTGVALQKTLLWASADLLIRASESRNAHGTVHLVAGGITSHATILEIYPFELTRYRFFADLVSSENASFDFSLQSHSALPIIWSMSVEAADSGRAWEAPSYVEIEPEEGVVDSSDVQEFRLNIATVDEAGGTLLRGGQYFGQLRLAVEDYYDDVILPIELTVRGMGVGDEKETLLPAELLTCYPQPFNSTVTIEYQYVGNGPVSFMIFDPTGKVVWQKRHESLSVGVHREVVGFEGIPAGVYLMRMEAAGSVRLRKVVCIK